MSKFIFSILLLTGISSLACPNLAGYYACSNSANEKFPVIIHQKIVDDVQVYNFNYKYQNMKPYDAIANNMPQKVDTADFNGFEKYYCETNTLVYKRAGDHLQDGKSYAHSTLLIIYKLDENENLQSELHLNLKNNDQQKPTEVKINEVCLKTL